MIYDFRNRRHHGFTKARYTLQVFVSTNLYVHTIIAHFFQYRPFHQNGECWSLRLVKNILLVGDFYAKRWYYKLTYCLDTVSTYVYISTVPPIYICMGFSLLIWWQVSSPRTYWHPLLAVRYPFSSYACAR